MRELSGCMLVTDLRAAGAHVRAYNPMPMCSAQALLVARFAPGDVERFSLVSQADEAPVGADMLALLSEWKEFSSPDLAASFGNCRGGI